MATIHKFGVRIDGELCTLFGTVDDKLFYEVTAAGLPEGWVAWHIDEMECDEPCSQRVIEIRNRPSLALRWQDAIEDAFAGRPLGSTGYPVQFVG
jgi:hypothetical protein